MKISTLEDLFSNALKAGVEGLREQSGVAVE